MNLDQEVNVLLNHSCVFGVVSSIALLSWAITLGGKVVCLQLRHIHTAGVACMYDES